MRIVLLRHGQTVSNVTHALDTAVPGPPLTGLGQRQAAAAATVLTGTGDPVRAGTPSGTGPSDGAGLAGSGLAGIVVDAVWASTALRARQTAAPLADALGVGVGVLDGLRETGAGELEMRTDEEAIARYVETIVAWGRGDLTARIPGAQDGAQVLARYDAAIDHVSAAGAAAGARCAVVVSHGAVIRLWTALRVRGVDVASMAQRWLENTGAVVVEAVRPEEIDRDRPWRLVEWHGEPLGGPSLAPDREQEGPLAPPPARIVGEQGLEG